MTTALTNNCTGFSNGVRVTQELLEGMAMLSEGSASCSLKVAIFRAGCYFVIGVHYFATRSCYYQRQ